MAMVNLELEFGLVTGLNQSDSQRPLDPGEKLKSRILLGEIERWSLSFLFVQE